MSIIFIATVDGIRTLKDGSLKVTFDTQEMAAGTAGDLIGYANQVVKVLISEKNVTKDVEELLEDLEVIDSKNEKSPSQRLRSVLYVLWEQDKAGYEDFNLFYINRMERFIDQIKERLND